MKLTKSCPVCGGNEFSHNDILWPELVSEWELLPHEVDYINRQQGLSCSACGNNLRSMALADSILKRYRFDSTLIDFVHSDIAYSLKLLEINKAGALSPVLTKIPGHVFIKYPEYDMTKLPFNQESFDIVLHSDTLEHVEDPIAGLAECKRVLNSSGVCIYTVPIIVGRLTRSRKGLKPSFHGSNEKNESDQMVYTEFGADAWQWPISAGFTSATIHSFEYPAAIAVIAE